MYLRVLHYSYYSDYWITKREHEEKKRISIGYHVSLSLYHYYHHAPLRQPCDSELDMTFYMCNITVNICIKLL